MLSLQISSINFQLIIYKNKRQYTYKRDTLLIIAPLPFVSVVPWTLTSPVWGPCCSPCSHFAFRSVESVAWDGMWWEYLHHGKEQTLESRAFCSCRINSLQRRQGSPVLPSRAQYSTQHCISTKILMGWKMDLSGRHLQKSSEKELRNWRAFSFSKTHSCMQNTPY